MRPSYRIIPLLHVNLLFAFSIFFIVAICAGMFAGSVLAAGLRQTETLVAAPSQAKSLPSAEWADKLREIVDKVATVAAPPVRIELMVSNMSSLNADQVTAIDERLKADLMNRRIRIVASDSDAHVNVTLSEGVEGYVIVADIRDDTVEQVFVVPVSKGAPSAKKIDGVALDATLVWEQPGKILDFALPAAAGEVPTMIVLEAGRIVFYVRKDSQWDLSQSIIIPPLRPWLRAPRGRLELSRGLGAGIARLPGVDCKGDFAHTETIQCGFVDQSTQSWDGAETALSKNAAIGGEHVALSLECDGRTVALGTGFGDWTQADFIQAFEMAPVRGEGGAASGKPIEFEGPVTLPRAAESGAVADAVVQNLKTGNYEAYIVTATCSQ